MAKNYWDKLINDSNTTKEILFLKIRDNYTSCLRHLYDDIKDIPDYDIYFSIKAVSEAEGLKKGYTVACVNRRGSDINLLHIKDISELPNFDNSYTWMEDDIFILINYKGIDITPLQFITQSFLEEVMHELHVGGIKNLKLQHMYDLFVSTGVIEFFYGFYHLDINFLQNLSALTYERNYTTGRILLPRYDTKNNKKTKTGLKVSLEESVLFSIDNIRQIRKFLELSNNELALVVSDNGRIIGLSDKPLRSGEAEIYIYGHMYWSINYGLNQRIVYRNARYRIPSSRKKSPELKEYLINIDKNLSDDQIDNLELIVDKLSSLKHGTILIIGEKNKIMSEKDRLTLARTGISIKPININEQFDLLQSFSMIDGAILMDTNCNCFCIGAILDGDAVAKGSRARGSRFNSTVNYIKRRLDFNELFLGIVVSDDGSIDAVFEDKIIRLSNGN